MARAFLLCLLIVGLLGTAAPAEQVTFKIRRDVKLGDHEVPVDAELRLLDVSATRISVESLVDLRQAQAAFVEKTTGATVVDDCNARIRVTDAVAQADDTALTLSGRIEAELFRCEGQLAGDPTRGEELFSGGLSVGVSASAEFRDNCLFFRLLDLQLTPLQLVDAAAESEKVEQVRKIFFKATDAFLERNPVCPELPAELASLSPTYDAGGTRELGDGGIGVFFQGSFDSSTATIIDILQVLQSKGVLPPPPR